MKSKGNERVALPGHPGQYVDISWTKESDHYRLTGILRVGEFVHAQATVYKNTLPISKAFVITKIKEQLEKKPLPSAEQPSTITYINMALPSISPTPPAKTSLRDELEAAASMLNQSGKQQVLNERISSVARIVDSGDISRIKSACKSAETALSETELGRNARSAVTRALDHVTAMLEKDDKIEPGYKRY